MKTCPLCDEEKPTKMFIDSALYKEHAVCMKCCRLASKRLDALTEFDIKLCEDLGLDYNLLNSYKGLLFDRLLNVPDIERIIDKIKNEPLE